MHSHQECIKILPVHVLSAWPLVFLFAVVVARVKRNRNNVIFICTSLMATGMEYSWVFLLTMIGRHIVSHHWWERQRDWLELGE